MSNKSTGRRSGQPTSKMSEKQYRDFFEKTLSGNYVSTPDGKLLDCNPAFTSMMGYDSKADILKINARHFYPVPKQRADFLKELKQKKILVNHEIQLIKKDRTTIYCLENVVGIFTSKNELEKIQGFIMDITRIKNLEKSLRQSQAELQNIFLVAPIGIGMVIDRVLKKVNNRFCEITGYAREELINKNTRFVYATDEDFEYVGREKYKQIKKFGTGSVETRFKHKNGKIIDVLVQSTPINPKELSEGITFTVLDITEQIKAQKERDRIFSLSQDLICIAGMDGYFKYVNPAWTQLLGYTTKELLSRPFIDFIHPDDHKINNAELARLAKGQKTFDFENRYVHKNGSIRHILWAATPHIDEKLIYSTGRDITDRKNTQTIIANNEKKYRTIIEGALEGITLFNDNGKILEVNNAFCKMIGYSRNELLNMTWKELTVLEKPADTNRHLHEIISTGSEKFETQYRRKDGRIIDVEVSARLHEKQSYNMVNFIRDITEQKNAERKLTEKQRILDQVGDIAKIGGWEIDLKKGRRTTWTESIYNIFEMNPEDGAPEMNYQIDWYIPEHRELVIEKMKELEETRQPIQFEAILKTASGKMKWCQTLGQVMEQNGKLAKLRGTLQDISERKAVEKALLDSEERFRSIYENSNVGIYRTTPEGNILMANLALIRMLGFQSFKEMAARNLEKNGFDFIHPRNKFLKLFEKDNTVKGFETTWKRADGSKIYLRENATAFRDPRGKIKYFDGFVEDITEQKKAREAVLESERRFRSLFESANDALAYLSLSGKILDANKAALKIFGGVRKNLIGKKINELDIFSTIDKTEAIAQFNQMLNDEGKPLTMSLINRKGKRIELESKFTIIYKMKKPIGVLIISRDITQRQKMEDKLQKVSRRAQKYLDITNVMIISINRKMKVELINKTACKLLGYKESDIVGKNWFSHFIPIGERDNLKRVFLELMSGKIHSYIESSILTRKGEKRIIAWYNTIIKDDNGNISGTLSSGADITERKRMIDQLRSSEERLKILFEFAPDAYYLNDLNGIFIDGNRQAEQLTGKKREDLIGKNLLKVLNLNTSDKLKAAKILAKNALGHPTERDEFTLTRPDGTQVVAEISTHPIKIGKESLVLGIARDITESEKMRIELEKYRKYLEELVQDRTQKLNISLSESEANRDRIDSILKSISEGLIFTDINHHIILMNSLAEDWLNIRFSQAYNQTIHQVFHQKKIVRLIEATQKSQEENLQFDLHMDNHLTGKNMILQVSSKSILDRKGKKMGALTSLRDVSHDREINRMKTEFLSTAAHELRTPLTTIRGFSEVLLNRRDLTEDEKGKFLNYINQQSVNLENIISELLDISRIESGLGFRLKRKVCSINGIALKLIENYRISFPNHTFVSELDETDTSVFADCEKIEQVMQNLLSNAVNYSPGGAKIQVSTKLAKDNYRVMIKDSGIGMTPEQVKKIFEKFYRADSSDTAPMGTGLGMSIVKLIIEAHNGKVWVESQLNKGTRVIFTLPIGLKDEDRSDRKDSGEIIV